MRPRHLVLVLVLGVPLAVACGTFGEGAEPSPQPDAGASDGSVSADGSSPVQPDGGGPGDDDGGIPPRRPCGIDVTCDDFEREFVEDPRWDDVAEAGGGLLSIVDTQAKDGTRSLRVGLASSSLTDRVAYLRKTFASKAVGVTARFWLRTDTIPTDADVRFAKMTTENGAVFSMFKGGTLVLAAEDGAKNTVDQATHPKALAAQWHEIAFDYRAGLPPKAKLSVDDTEVQIALPNGFGAVSAIEIGATSATAGSGAVYFIDDVNIDRGL